jgi:hypothetical protein
MSEQLLHPDEFFREVRIGDYIVFTPEGFRYYVVDITPDDDPYDPGKVLVFGACGAKRQYYGATADTVKLRLSHIAMFEGKDRKGDLERPVETLGFNARFNGIDYEAVRYARIFAHRAGDLERRVEMLRLNPGSWLMRRN